MRAFAEKCFLREIIQQAHFIEESCKRLNLALDRRNSLNIFDAVESIVDRAARMALIVFPVLPKKGKFTPEQEARKLRGEALRKGLGVDESHALFDRRLRHNLQHYDERLDDWNAAGHQVLVGMVLGEFRAVINGAPPLIERNYLPDTKEYRFRGEAFNIQEILSGAEDLRDRAEQRNQEIDRCIAEEVLKSSLSQS